MAFLKYIMIALILSSGVSYAEKIKNVTDISGVSDNALIGYGIVVGLDGTGDTSNSSPFTINSITAMLEKLGVNVRSNIANVKPKNIAAVIVTAKLPSFSKAGQSLDVTVSSLGDSKSLRGGTLLITPLLAGGGKIYAVAQGAVSVGGFSFSGNGTSNIKNHPTVGKIPNGARVQQNAPRTISKNQKYVAISLKVADFGTAIKAEEAINKHFGTKIAEAEDGATIIIANKKGNAIRLLAQVGNIEFELEKKAVVVIDERTGTIIMGSDVKIDTVAVAHGNISVTIDAKNSVSQPGAFSSGVTTPTSKSKIKVKEQVSKLVVLPKQVSLSKLVNALNAVGASPSDLISVLQAIKAAGALHAELNII